MTLTAPEANQRDADLARQFDAVIAAGFAAPLPNQGEVQVTDMFAGGGGSSTGMDQVPGVKVHTAANHLALAMDVHQANHPDTDHAVVDLHMEDPRFFKTTDVLWASPECTRWSQANSTDLPEIEADLFMDADATNAANQSRLLMFDVLRYIEHHRYRRVIVENVVDIAVLAKYALAWQTWKRDLHNLGYEFVVVFLNSMHAQFAGLPAPQSRDRLYIIAWPKGETPVDVTKVMRPKAYCPTCGKTIRARQSWKPGRTVGRYRAQYVYVDPSCGTVVEPAWLPAASAIDWSLPGERIGDRATPLAAKTRARIAAGIQRYWRTEALAVPVEGRDGKEARPVHLPGRTQTCRAETGLAVSPIVAELRGGGSVAHSTGEPLSTVTASGNHHLLVEPPPAGPQPLITPAGGSWNDTATPASNVLRTLTTRDSYALLAPYYSSGSGETARTAMDTLGALTTRDRYALVQRHNDGGAEMLTPAVEEMRTLTTKGHQSVIAPPMDKAAAEALVEDCFFRMLQPHEVAGGMAFPKAYRWQPYTDKRVSNRDLVKLAGNAVTPPASRDLMCAVLMSLGVEFALAA